jgi:hypothetical protein
MGDALAESFADFSEANTMNLNTILAPLSVGRLRDPLLVAVDLWLLGTNDYRAVFPIVDHAWGFALLERAYLFLFAQIVCVVVWQSWIRPRSSASGDCEAQVSCFGQCGR